jgi:hypothetical protein
VALEQPDEVGERARPAAVRWLVELPAEPRRPPAEHGAVADVRLERRLDLADQPADPVAGTGELVELSAVALDQRDVPP